MGAFLFEVLNFEFQWRAGISKSAQRIENGYCAAIQNYQSNGIYANPNSWPGSRPVYQPDNNNAGHQHSNEASKDVVGAYIRQDRALGKKQVIYEYDYSHIKQVAADHIPHGHIKCSKA